MFFAGWMIEVGDSYNMPFILSGFIGLLGCVFYGAALILKKRLWYNVNEEYKHLL